MAENPPAPEGRALYQNLGLALGPVAAAMILLFFWPTNLPAVGTYTAAIAVCMAIWWATEAVPVPVTGFLPIVLYPLFGIQTIKETLATSYAHPTVYLFLGGFIMALAIERSGLHLRLALNIFRWVGVRGRSLIGGFMVVAALLSMWISNTSTTMMLLPITASIIFVMRESMKELHADDMKNFEMALLLGLAYGATLGGIATLVGTPPNVFMAGFMSETYGVEVSFARWILIGVPITLVMLPITWMLLTRVLFPVKFEASAQLKTHIHELHLGLGSMRAAEKRVGLLFLLLVSAWIFREPLAQWTGLTGLTDAGVAMTAAVAAFIIPSGKKGEALVTWEDTARLPWGVLILFGGGLALAGGMSSSGLTLFLGQQLAPLAQIHIAVLVLASVVLVIFLTELTSNLATTATILPVMGAIAVETGQDPLLFTIPVTLAASCAFMLPVATPPNAIVFSSGSLTIPQMMRAGVWLNLIGVLILSLVALKLVPMVFG